MTHTSSYSTQQLDECIDTIVQLVGFPIHKKIASIDTLALSHDHLLTWLDLAVEATRQTMLASIGKGGGVGGPRAGADLVRRLMAGSRHASAHVNPKLVLDNVFLDYHA